jgi:hypothetical protein
LTVIVVSFFELVLRDHSKDHAVAVVYFDDTLTAEPYTTLLDSTGSGPWSHSAHPPREAFGHSFGGTGAHNDLQPGVAERSEGAWQQRAQA